MIHETYNWSNLISKQSRECMTRDIENTIHSGKFWHNSPPYQTNINIFGLNSDHWINLKMSFIWSCFAFMGKEAQIKSIKSWGYMTNLDTEENRDNYWHQHLRDGSLTVSGVYYLSLPEDVKDTSKAGTELAPSGVEGTDNYFVPWEEGCWMIFPGKTWHRPGIVQSKQNRFIVAADMEI